MSNDKNNAATATAADEVARILAEAEKQDFRGAVHTAFQLADHGAVWMKGRIERLADRLLAREVAKAKSLVSGAHHTDARGWLASDRTGKRVNIDTTDLTVSCSSTSVSVSGWVVIGNANNSIGCHLSDAGVRLLNAYATVLLWYASGNHDIKAEPGDRDFVHMIIHGLLNTNACALVEAAYTLDFARRDNGHTEMWDALERTLWIGQANSRIFKAIKRRGRADEMLEEGIEIFRNDVGKRVFDCVKTHANNAEMIFVRYEDDTTEVFPAATIVEVRAAS